MSVLVEVKERLSIFNGFYEYIRIVDPHQKKVIDEVGGESAFGKGIIGENCFDFWKQKGMCRNCVAYRAFYENRTITKFERNDQKLFMTMATPLIHEGKKYIVEILKEINDGDHLIDAEFKTPMPLRSTIMSLNDLANTDALTGAFNRRYIDYQLEQEMRYSHFHQEELTILLIDIDHFKNINDQYGHLKGDQILVEFVSLLKGMLRQELDWIGRYGGEEFIIVLNRTSVNSARLVAERLRHQVEKEFFKIDELMISLTCSVGVSSMKPIREEPSDLIERADLNLYRAKTNGRNQVVAI